MHYTTVNRPKMILMGIACRTSNAPGKAEIDISKLWERFLNENIANKIPNKSSSEVFGVYCDYEGDHTKPYSLVIGCPVSEVSEVPEGFVVKEIPECSYAKYQAKGEHPTALVETWGSIWQTDLPRAYTFDFEVYGDKFTSGDPKEVDVYIALSN